jgi:hypothetical protein
MESLKRPVHSQRQRAKIPIQRTTKPLTEIQTDRGMSSPSKTAAVRILTHMFGR